MDSKKEIYEIEFTEDCWDEIRDIYKYISDNLKTESAAKRLYIFLICIMEKGIIWMVYYSK